jgi:hypothetical protein
MDVGDNDPPVKIEEKKPAKAPPVSDIFAIARQPITFQVNTAILHVR